MPRCEYCGATPYETYCKSFHQHVEACRRRFHDQRELERLREVERRREEDRARELERLRNQRPQVNNYIQIHNLCMGNQSLYLDYPKNDSTQKVIRQVETLDIRSIKSEEDIKQLMDDIQNMNNNEILNCITGTNTAARSQALSFLADIMRIIRMRLINEAPLEQCLIEGAEEFEKECLEEKKQLVPTIEDI